MTKKNTFKKKKIEQLITPIEHAPDNFEAIINYGAQPTQQIGVVFLNVMHAQAELIKQVEAASMPDGQILAGFKKIETLGKKLKADIRVQTQFNQK